MLVRPKKSNYLDAENTGSTLRDVMMSQMMMMFRTAASVMVAAWSQFSSTLLQRLDLVKAECQGETSDDGRRVMMKCAMCI